MSRRKTRRMSKRATRPSRKGGGLRTQRDHTGSRRRKRSDSLGPVVARLFAVLFRVAVLIWLYYHEDNCGR